MNLQEYQLAAARTCPSLGEREDGKDLDLIHMDMGIFTEVAEIIDICKKKLAYKKEIDLVHLGEEIADASWYCVNKLRFMEISINQTGKPKVFEPDVIKVYELLEDYMIQDGEDANFLLYILNCLAASFGLNYEELLDKNIAKLKVRYPDKFDTNRAINRNLDDERKTLE